ncbi:MAG: DUF1217 domain-containing protein [Thalassovita sp.]
MSFQPIIPATGLVGWRFLERSFDTQTKIFQADSVMTRDTEYFEAHIGTVETAEDLVSDRRLLSVALGAFGLDADLDNRFFIKKILEEGTIDPAALANKMSDSRYQDLAEAFGFDLGVPNSKLSTFAGEIIEGYRARQFEVAVGDQDESMRFALNAKRELAELAESDESDRTRWFKIMGNEPLRQVMEGALGLPDSFSQIDLDQQLTVFTERSEQQLGLNSLDELANPEALDQLIERYLLRSEAASVQVSSAASIALTLLQS